MNLLANTVQEKINFRARETAGNLRISLGEK